MAAPLRKFVSILRAVGQIRIKSLTYAEPQNFNTVSITVDLLYNVPLYNVIFAITSLFCRNPYSLFFFVFIISYRLVV